MIKSLMTAAMLAVLLTGPAMADDDDWRDVVQRYDGRDDYGRHYDHGRKHRRGWHTPPARYRADYGYRSAYELAWRDWARHGRHHRNRQHASWRGYSRGYRSGYDDGWRDAARYYGRGYRPRDWRRDAGGSWYFDLLFDD